MEEATSPETHTTFPTVMLLLLCSSLARLLAVYLSLSLSLPPTRTHTHTYNKHKHTHTHGCQLLQQLQLRCYYANKDGVKMRISSHKANISRE